MSSLGPSDTEKHQQYRCHPATCSMIYYDDTTTRLAESSTSKQATESEMALTPGMPKLYQTCDPVQEKERLDDPILTTSRKTPSTSTSEWNALPQDVVETSTINTFMLRVSHDKTK